MVKVFGVQRDKCEYKGCNKKAKVIITSSISQGLNTWVYCKEHGEKQYNMIEKIKGRWKKKVN